ncbi:MAG: hypothetical protein ACK5IQ_07145 [Bacteroidales bacterium]
MLSIKQKISNDSFLRKISAEHRSYAGAFTDSGIIEKDAIVQADRDIVSHN